MNIGNKEDIAIQLSESEEKLKQLKETLLNLQSQKERRNNPNIIKEENEDLKLFHQLCLDDIKSYNENLSKLKEEKKQNEAIINKLKEENEKLKQRKKSSKKESKAYKNLILNMRDLCTHLGFQLKKNDSGVSRENKNNVEEEKMANLEILKKKKAEFEGILTELKINLIRLIILFKDKLRQLMNIEKV